MSKEEIIRELKWLNRIDDNTNDSKKEESSIPTYEVEKEEDNLYRVTFYSELTAAKKIVSSNSFVTENGVEVTVNRSKYEAPEGFKLVGEKYAAKDGKTYYARVYNGNINVVEAASETTTLPAAKTTSYVTYTDENGEKVTETTTTYYCPNGGVLIGTNEVITRNYFFDVTNAEIISKVESAINEYNKENNSLIRK